MRTTRLPDGSSSENPVTRTSRIAVVLAGTIVLTLSGGTSALTFASSGRVGDGTGVTGTDALTRASEAALVATGGGVVTATEFDAEDRHYEVQVALVDGRHVEVRLDESFAVMSKIADVEDSADTAV
jgi:hypothetical protein